jgi:hypothetical protein
LEADPWLLMVLLLPPEFRLQLVLLRRLLLATDSPPTPPSQDRLLSLGLIILVQQFSQGDTYGCVADDVSLVVVVVDSFLRRWPCCMITRVVGGRIKGRSIGRGGVILLLRFFGMMFCHDHPVAAFVEASSQKMKIEQQHMRSGRMSC